MSDSCFLPEQKSLERMEFEYFMRTGRVLTNLAEFKFGGNPYHDELGKFTSEERAVSPRIGSQRQNQSVNSNELGRGTARYEQLGKQIRRVPLRLRIGRDRGVQIADLSPLHNRVRALAVKYPPSPGTREWTPVDLANWKLAGGDIFEFKRQWVRGYRNAINVAARRFDLPPTLVAGVAFNEVGGDPVEVDRLAYNLRSLVGSPTADRTSFGNMSLQFRRAASSLGYDGRRELSERQRAYILNSLENPQINIFIAAKHLSDLRNVDFAGVPRDRLTLAQIEVIASRYNRGPDLPRDQIEKNLLYGKAISKRWAALQALVR
jgi:hypothetical protein